MGKRDVDRKVAEAMKLLTASKEDAIRDLAAVLDDIESIDDRLAALNRDRDRLIEDARAKHATAKQAGWKVRELSDAGLTVPRPITMPLDRGADESGAQSASGSGEHPSP